MPPINYVAILGAAVASWLAGAVWYGILGKQWIAALGWSEASESACIDSAPVISTSHALGSSAWLIMLMQVQTLQP